MIESAVVREGEILVVGESSELTERISKDIDKSFKGRYKVNTSKDSRQILERLKTESHKLRLVVVDLDEKDINPLQVLKVLRNFDKKLPLVVISETENINLAIKAAKSGADDFISKPVTRKEITEVIENIENIRQRQAGSAPFDNMPDYICNMITRVKNEMLNKRATLEEATSNFKNKLIVFVLTKVKGDKVKASKILGLSDIPDINN